jgi:aldose 1-epimerase
MLKGGLKMRTNWLRFTGCMVATAMVAMVLCSCHGTQGSAGTKEAKEKMDIKVETFGSTPEGRQVRIYRLTNANGLKAGIMTYGATVVSLEVPDKAGRMDDIVLGYDNLESYIKNSPYFGAIVGRYGNRIAKGRFRLGDEEYALATNNGENHLHGGVRGFDKVVWSAEPGPANDGPSLRLRYTSKDGEEGYPGTLSATVVYTLTESGELRIEYSATTDKPTVVNLTHHSYFNLAGDGDVLGHELTIDADRFTPVDAGLIPTGELKGVAGTPFDFRKPTAIGARIGQDDPQLLLGKGYDHNFVLNRKGAGAVAVARLREPKSGRVVEVLTTEPGLQFYSGNFLDGSLTGKGGKVYKHRYGLCLEAQHFPDSPNQPAFPSTRLDPGQRYESTTVYRFSVEK